MDKVELYRQVFSAFKKLCAAGEQPCSFRAYCRNHGVNQCQMPFILKDEFQNVKALPGYKLLKSKQSVGILCSQIYEDFKHLCAEGRQPGTFTSYCNGYGITFKQMDNNLNRNKLRVIGLPGFSMPTRTGLPRGQEIPFEKIIFEEAGFLPASESSVITIKVDGHVTVSFPANTDVAVIAKFVRQMTKEASRVGA